MKFIAFACWLTLLCGLRAADAPQPTDTSLPVLTSAQQILDLGLEVARRAPHPVRLRGWITYPEPESGLLYVQDGSGGIRVHYTNASYEPVSGQQVLVRGSTAAGMFAPC